MPMVGTGPDGPGLGSGAGVGENVNGPGSVGEQIEVGKEVRRRPWGEPGRP